MYSIEIASHDKNGDTLRAVEDPRGDYTRRAADRYARRWNAALARWLAANPPMCAKWAIDSVLAEIAEAPGRSIPSDVARLILMREQGGGE